MCDWNWRCYCNGRHVKQLGLGEARCRQCGGLIPDYREYCVICQPGDEEAPLPEDPKLQAWCKRNFPKWHAWLEAGAKGAAPND
jgi:hypothetical protein